MNKTNPSNYKNKLAILKFRMEKYKSEAKEAFQQKDEIAYNSALVKLNNVKKTYNNVSRKISNIEEKQAIINDSLVGLEIISEYDKSNNNSRNFSKSDLDDVVKQVYEMNKAMDKKMDSINKLNQIPDVSSNFSDEDKQELNDLDKLLMEEFAEEEKKKDDLRKKSFGGDNLI